MKCSFRDWCEITEFELLTDKIWHSREKDKPKTNQIPEGRNVSPTRYKPHEFIKRPSCILALLDERTMRFRIYKYIEKESREWDKIWESTWKTNAHLTWSWRSVTKQPGQGTYVYIWRNSLAWWLVINWPIECVYISVYLLDKIDLGIVDLRLICGRIIQQETLQVFKHVTYHR